MVHILESLAHLESRFDDLVMSQSGTRDSSPSACSSGMQANDSQVSHYMKPTHARSI